MNPIVRSPQSLLVAVFATQLRIMNDKISVIIPTYNAARHITRAVDSVLSQDYRDYEIIVIDDGSTDGTQEVLVEYADRIKYVFQNNGGAAKARNTGIMHAQGDYIAFLDADDLWLPTKLRMQIEFFHNFPQYAMVYTDMKHAVESKIIYDSYLREENYRYVSSGFIYENLLRECFIFTPTVMLKKECLEKVGLFNEHFKICEDWDLWLRIADEYQIGFMEEPSIIRNRWAGNLTGNRHLYITSSIQMFEELYTKNKANKKRAKIIDRALGVRYFNLGYYFFDLGQLKSSRCNFLKSLKHRYSTKFGLYTLASLLPQSWINGVRGFKRKTKYVS